MKSRIYLAADLGASGGRVIAGRFDGRKIELDEFSRFEHNAEEINGGFYWNISVLWQGVLNGLEVAKEKLGTAPTSIGVDTWAVDFVLLDETDQPIGDHTAAVSYRDPRTDGMIEKALEVVPRFEIFEHSGLQFMQFNTLFQLLALKQKNPEVLEKAKSFLMIPDFFNYKLSGKKFNEFTNATTTQLFNPAAKQWSEFLLDKFGFPREIFLDIVQPFTDLGKVDLSNVSISGLSDLRVIVPGTHDTASSVFSVPATGRLGECDWCYICLGTWALIGVESLSPIMSREVYDLNFTNEGGVGGTTRVLKNVTGLWLLQECRRIWNERGRNLQWNDMNELIRNAVPLRSLVDPDNREFLCPTDMPEAIADFCKNTNQHVPANEGEILRCAIDSIAVRIGQVLEMCEQITGKNIKTIHIVGGGSKNHLLCQAIADAAARPVLAGPVESTAIGNIMCQAIAIGDVENIGQAREIIRNSFELTKFIPNNENKDKWKQASEFIRKLKENF
ncbi:MAG: rhamnulokinase [Planctomycetaceae bacterium]|jgi:rhamnulokinase|nr:rhamnulokinase [Planctomycetaceae bacterium]